MLDILIRGASVFDGFTVEPRRLSVGVSGNKIAYLGPDLHGLASHSVVEAENLFLCPGFIDTHASTGLGYTLPRAGDNKLFQGVTTEIIGNCGTSPAPIGELLAPTMSELAQQIGFHFDWTSLDDWFARVEAFGLPFNIGTFVGHSTLRAGICEDAQQVTNHEIEQMVRMVAKAGDEGALGLSTGLVYAPGSFATTAEIVVLAREIARSGGIYVSHIRDERQGLIDSIEETLEIAVRADLPILVSHLKAAEKPNWGKIPRVIEIIEDARRNHRRITFEVYPYTAVSTKLRTFIPKWLMANGSDGMVRQLEKPDTRAESVAWLRDRETDFATMRLITESVPGGSGRSIAEIADRHQLDPAETAIDILLADPDAWIVYHCISQEDLDAAILWSDSIICSDSWSYPINSPNQIGDPHPRTFGAFTRFLENYSLSEQRLPFGEAVRKITSLPASWLGLDGRGRIEVGAYADLVLLDPRQVREKATYENPRQMSEGTRAVWVNGCQMLADGTVADESPGTVIRGGRARH